MKNPPRNRRVFHSAKHVLIGRSDFRSVGDPRNVGIPADGGTGSAACRSGSRRTARRGVSATYAVGSEGSSGSSVSGYLSSVGTPVSACATGIRRSGASGRSGIISAVSGTSDPGSSVSYRRSGSSASASASYAVRRAVGASSAASAASASASCDDAVVRGGRRDSDGKAVSAGSSGSWGAVPSSAVSSVTSFSDNASVIQERQFASDRKTAGRVESRRGRRARTHRHSDVNRNRRLKRIGSVPSCGGRSVSEMVVGDVCRDNERIGISGDFARAAVPYHSSGTRRRGGRISVDERSGGT